MKKFNFFQKKQNAEKNIISDRELRNVEKSRTNLLEETMLIDEEFSIIRDFKNEDIKVIDIEKEKNDFYNQDAIDLETELLKEITPKKKPRLWRYLMFGILAILIIVMIIIITIKVKL